MRKRFPIWTTTTAFGLFLSVLFGMMTGLGVFTFHYAEGGSYFSSDPKACVNCHIMREQYDGWQKASHHGVATCNDCHIPHDFVNKYIVKAENGFWHSKGFTFQDFPEPIRIRPKNARVLQENCLHCHRDMMNEILAHQGRRETEPINCVQCHATVGHGPLR